MGTAVVTPEFVDRVLRSGELTRARTRLDQGTARPRNRAKWDTFSSWALVCEEVLDTEHEPEWYDDILAELLRRGFTHDQIDAMRRLAWETAGWLNYDRMLWEWVRLDEDDIRRALDRQWEEGLISLERYSAGIHFLHHPGAPPAG